MNQVTLAHARVEMERRLADAADRRRARLVRSDVRRVRLPFTGDRVN
ncbi:MAG: hypothetical protein KDB63_01625 [Nocardioidaceae bacterium]|nr:hypothetical protein [Nocardioidaceae bacterium]